MNSENTPSIPAKSTVSSRLGQILRLGLRPRSVLGRRGSVLILVIALLVLLALIGTAYLSSTQTERFTSHQASINTEADLLLQGMINSVQSEIAGGVFGNTGNGTSQYRPAYPDGSAPISGAYYNYDSIGTAPPSGASYLATDPDPCDMWLADRLPQILLSNPTWGNVSWPLFKDSSGEYTFDSPLVGNPVYLNGSATPVTEQSLHLGIGERKGSVQFAPGYYSLNDGSIVPAMIVSGSAYNNPDGTQFPATVGGVPQPNQAIMAASAAGDGIADSLLCKVPGGPINGITYYVATRIVDSNSAVNASSAWDLNNAALNGDPKFTSGETGANDGTTFPTYGTGGNFGFFRSNIGLTSLLDPNATAYGSAITPASEINALNQYRFGGPVQPASMVPATAVPVLHSTPIYNDPTNLVSAPTNFRWFSYGDAIDNVLTARAGNPGWVGTTAGSGSQARMQWLGIQQSAALAYKFTLRNPLLPYSALEQFFPNELVTLAPSTPYAASQYGQWYADNFRNFTSPYSGDNKSLSVGLYASPLRSILTGHNPVSNATPSRFGNISAPVTWKVAPFGKPNTYQFGDWVTEGGRSYVCIQSHQSTHAVPYEPATNTGVGYWAGATETVPPAQPTGQPVQGLPWTTQPVKANINTATFEELWLAFAQVMTDTVGPDPAFPGGPSQWLPPQQPSLAGSATGQMPQFRSSWRVPGGTSVLPMSQMLKIRAALAAVNAIDLRGGPNDASAATNPGAVSSRRITLTNPSLATPSQQYNVEVFGARPQPFISEMVVQIEDPGGSGFHPGVGGAHPAATVPTTTNTFIAIELVNPYPVPISCHNWQLCAMDRTQAATGMQLTPLDQLNGGSPGSTSLLDALTLPAAQSVAGVITPSVTVIASAATAKAPTPPRKPVGTFTSPIPPITALVNALGKELVIVRPRCINGTLSASTDPADPYGTEDFKTALGCSAMVPVDQLDLTGTDTVSGATAFTATDYPIRLQYRRGSTPASAGNSYAWNCVYPGPYDLSVSATPDFTQPQTPKPYFRTQGIILEKADEITPGNLGATDTGPATKTSPTNANTTYDTAPIQWANIFAAGANPLYYADATKMNAHPFGHFARNVDMLQVPFIGAYTITQPSATAGTIVEMNSVTMDSAQAYDTGLFPLGGTPAAGSAVTASTTGAGGNVYLEQIGRFCPVGDPSSTDDTKALDFGFDTAASNNYHYHWARRLFDYLTVQSPQNDFYPNVDPAVSSTYGLVTHAVNPPTPTRYPGNISDSPGVYPVPVSNDDPTATNVITSGKSEDTVGVQGLININTAPEAVLAQLPFHAAVTNDTGGQTQQDMDAQVARGIVLERTKHGAFKSIFDLYRVPEFLALNSQMLTTPPTPLNGLFTPGGLPNLAGTQSYNTSTVRYDFNERFLLLNNISNLITTRSDTFTCYVLLQGWRNVGTSNPTLAVQRRAAFIIDRNGVTPGNVSPTMFRLPAD